MALIVLFQSWRCRRKVTRRVATHSRTAQTHGWGNLGIAKNTGQAAALREAPRRFIKHVNTAKLLVGFAGSACSGHKRVWPSSRRWFDIPVQKPLFAANVPGRLGLLVDSWRRTVHAEGRDHGATGRPRSTRDSFVARPQRTALGAQRDVFQ
jgi:hypothetical protein